ncbi:tafazzin isoform X4 [Hydra vulgaris]|uniref:Tafazzin family protein n=1 Tax=Hydra vulgaris TaxID=6087 RepID=A0ABM4DJ29_HYDVU
MVVAEKLKVLHPLSANLRYLSANSFSQEHRIVPKKNSLGFKLQSTFWISAVGCVGKILVDWCNRVTIYNRELFLNLIHDRPAGTPLITVSNHTSMFDDPGILATIMDLKALVNQRKMRWSMAAKEICFATCLTSYVSHHGKLIPIERGKGVYQDGVNYAIQKLNAGDWIHVFPEGKITSETVRLKWGVGRMINECVKTPIILPFWHVGMQEFLPLENDIYIPFFGHITLPRIKKKITILFGDPIPVCDILLKFHSGELNEVSARIQLTNRIQGAFQQLRIIAEDLHTNRGFLSK